MLNTVQWHDMALSIFFHLHLYVCSHGSAFCIDLELTFNGLDFFLDFFCSLFPVFALLSLAIERSQLRKVHLVFAVNGFGVFTALF